MLPLMILFVSLALMPTVFAMYIAPNRLSMRKLGPTQSPTLGGPVLRRIKANRSRPRAMVSPYQSGVDYPSSATQILHIADGVECREVAIDVDGIGPVTVLEATAESQEALVDAALVLEDESLEAGSVSLDVGDPYGSVLWPAASAVANHLMRNFDVEERRTTKLLELGSGTGLVALAAARGGYQHVVATDYESVPLSLLGYGACHLNGDVDLSSIIAREMLNICDFSVPLPEADLVVAADIMYEPATGRAVARRVVEALSRGSRVVIGCSPGRPGRPAFLEELREIVPGIQADFVDAEGTTCSGERHNLICGEGSTSVSAQPKLLMVKVMDLCPSCLPSPK